MLRSIPDKLRFWTSVAQPLASREPTDDPTRVGAEIGAKECLGPGLSLTVSDKQRWPQGSRNVVKWYPLTER
jgi:hypothetical protein